MLRLSYTVCAVCDAKQETQKTVVRRLQSYTTVRLSLSKETKFDIPLVSTPEGSVSGKETDPVAMVVGGRVRRGGPIARQF